MSSKQWCNKLLLLRTTGGYVLYESDYKHAHLLPEHYDKEEPFHSVVLELQKEYPDFNFIYPCGEEEIDINIAGETAQKIFDGIKKGIRFSQDTDLTPVNLDYRKLELYKEKEKIRAQEREFQEYCKKNPVKDRVFIVPSFKLVHKRTKEVTETIKPVETMNNQAVKSPSRVRKQSVKQLVKQSKSKTMKNQTVNVKVKKERVATQAEVYARAGALTLSKAVHGTAHALVEISADALKYGITTSEGSVAYILTGFKGSFQQSLKDVRREREATTAQFKANLYNKVSEVDMSKYANYVKDKMASIKRKAPAPTTEDLTTEDLSNLKTA